jgi:hypothetical protein
MERHALGTFAGGVSGMKAMCDLFSSGAEPTSLPVTYETVGVDLNAKPIEAGFGSTVLSWTVLAQSDYDYILGLQGDTPGSEMYVRAQKRNGASGIEFANFRCVAYRPIFEEREGLLCRNVTMQLMQMLEI